MDEPSSELRALARPKRSSLSVSPLDDAPDEMLTYSISDGAHVDIDGNGAPSGPNCTLFSDADRLLDSLRDRSGVG